MARYFLNIFCAAMVLASASILNGCSNAADIASLSGADKAITAATTSSGSSGSTNATAMLISGSTTSGVVGTCYGPFTVTTVNTANVTTAVTAATSVNLTVNGSGTYYSDAGCTASVTSRSLAIGDSTTTFYYNGDTPGFQTFYSSASGLGNATYPFNIQAGAPSSISISGNASVASGSCSSAITATLKDVGANTAKATALTTLTLSGAGSGTYYSDAACSASITTATIAANSSSATFYFKDSTPETVTITAASGALTSGTLSMTVSAAATATRLSISASSALTTATTCFGPFTITSTDNSGNAVSVTSATAVTLSTSGSGSFYTGATCATGTSAATISSGASSTSVYFKSSIAETQSLFATASGLTGASTSFTVLAGAASEVILTGPGTLAGGSCSSAITATLKDADANIAKSSGTTTLTLSGGGSGTFYSDASCASSTTSVNISSNQSTATFYFKDSTGESLTLTAASAGLTSGTLGITVAALATATKLNFSMAASTAAAGTCYGPIYIQSTDSSNNTVAVTANKTVALAGAGSGAFYSDVGCGTPAASVVISSGTYQTSFYYKNNTTEVELFVATNGTLATAVYPFTVTAGVPAKLTITGGATLSAGACSAVFTVYLKDTLNNIVTSTGVTAVALSGGGSGTFYSEATCTTSTTTADIANAASSSTFYFKDSTAESLTVTAANGSLASGTTALTVNAGTVTQLSLAVPATIQAGICSSAFTVTTKDSSSNTANVSGATVVTLSGASNGVFYSASDCTGVITTVSIGSGNNNQTFFYKNTTAETVTIGTTATGLAATSQSYTVSANAINKIVVTGASSSDIQVCSATPLTMTTTDQYGNAINVGATTTINVSTSGTGTFYSDACVTPVTSRDISSGASSTTFYYKGTVVESATLTAAATGLTSGTRAYTVAATAPTKIVWSGSATPTSNTCTTYTLQLQDAGSFNTTTVADKVITLSGNSYGSFYSDGACASAITTKTITAGTGSATIYFKDVVGETLTLSAAGSSLTAGTLGIVLQRPALTTQEVLIGGWQMHGFADGVSTASRFVTPSGTATDGTYLYVVDSGATSGVIRRMNISTQVWDTIAGLPSTQTLTNGAYGANQIHSVLGSMAVLGGYLYFAETGYHQIRRLDLTTGIMTTIAGLAVTTGIVDGTGAAARFNAPHAVTTDGIDLYITDRTNNCVRKMTTSFVVTTVAGTCGAAAGNVDSVVDRALVRFGNLYGITATGGYLYVVDGTYHTVRRIDPATGFTINIAGSTSAVAGLVDATGTAARFNAPTTITTDGTNLYVGDSTNNAIRKVVISSGVVTTIAGGAANYFMDGTVGAEARFSAGTYWNAIYDNGNLYITDYTNSAIRKLVLSTTAVTTIGGMPPANFINGRTFGYGINTDGIQYFGKVYQPTAYVQVGNMLYFSERAYHMIRSVNLVTKQSGLLAGLANTAGTTDGVGAGARFNAPYGIATDNTNIYVADYSNHCIRKVVIATGTVTTLSGLCGTSGNVDHATSTSVRFLNPTGLAIDSSNTYLYVVDRGNHTIKRVTIATGASAVFAGSTAGAAANTDGTGTAARFYNLWGIVMNGTDLYVSDTNTGSVRKITTPGAVVTTIAGGSLGNNDGTNATGRMNTIGFMCTDGSFLYAPDYTNNNIRKINLSTGAMTTFVGQSAVWPGTANYQGQYGDLADGTLTLGPQLMYGCLVNSSGFFFGTTGGSTNTQGDSIRWIH